VVKNNGFTVRSASGKLSKAMHMPPAFWPMAFRLFLMAKKIHL